MRHARPTLLLVARLARCATSRVSHQSALREVSLGRVPRRSLPLFEVVFVVVGFLFPPFSFFHSWVSTRALVRLSPLAFKMTF